MPNPNGTRTKAEIRADIIERMAAHVAAGVNIDEALTKASAEVKQDIETVWAGKTAEVLRFLGIKSN